MSVFDTVLEFAPAVGLTTAGIISGNPYLIGAGIGSGVGAIKGREARAQSERKMKAEAEKTKYAPWTKQYGDVSRVAQANVFGNILQGGLQGAAIGGMFGGGAGAAGAKGTGAVEGATTTEAALAKEAAAGSSGIAGDRTSSEGLQYFFPQQGPQQATGQITAKSAGEGLSDEAIEKVYQDITTNRLSKVPTKNKFGRLLAGRQEPYVMGAL